MQDKQRLPRTESVPLSNVANVLLTGHRARRGRYDAPQRPFADDNGTIGQVRIRNTLTSASSFIAAAISAARMMLLTSAALDCSPAAAAVGAPRAAATAHDAGPVCAWDGLVPTTRTRNNETTNPSDAYPDLSIFHPPIGFSA